MAAQKKKQGLRNQDTLLEQLRDLGGGTVKTTANDLVGGVASGFINEFLGPKRADLKPGETVTLPQETVPTRPVTEVKKPEVIIFTAQEANLAQEVEAFRAELKKTAEELHELNTSVVEVEKAVAQTPARVGKYHLAFFARLRAILRLFRQQVNESRMWLEESFNKKRKRQFWSMFKKHGTSFGLSSERAVSQQAG